MGKLSFGLNELNLQYSEEMMSIGATSGLFYHTAQKPASVIQLGCINARVLRNLHI